MKKVLVLFVLSLVIAVQGSQAKDNKKVKVPEKARSLKLVTKADTLSYAAGVTMTNGLRPYLEQQLKVDTAYMALFSKGFMEARAKMGDKEFDAYVAGMRVAQMIAPQLDRKSTRLNSSHANISYAVFCLKKKKY